MNPAMAKKLESIPPPDTGEFDETEKMVLQDVKSPGYHTRIHTGQVHKTRESLQYAALLYRTATASSIARGEAIIRRVLPLQDQDPASNTYGIWSWFLEEPLAQMSPPDWNWADFLAVPLLDVMQLSAQHVSLDLRAQILQAISHAAASIQRRDVKPDYTNIAIMGTYVTLAAARLLDSKDLRSYSDMRLKRLYDFTEHHGGFVEYNSPTYTIVALIELGRLKQVAPPGEATRMAESLYHTAWREIAQHFHFPSLQWAGPHSRAYSSLLSPDTLSLIEDSSGGRIKLFNATLGNSEHLSRDPLPIPNDLIEYFVSLEDAKELVKTFVEGDPSTMGTTYLHPGFALGSINHANLWNQARALLAHWRTADGPAYLQLRFLRDGYDFHAAQYAGVQKGGTALGIIRFAVDQGVHHPHFDRMTDGSFSATDLRVRFEFGGTGRGVVGNLPKSLDEPLLISHGNIQFRIEVPFARFGELTGRWEPGRDEQRTWYDVVLYTGTAKRFILPELDCAVVALLVSLNQEAPPTTVAEVESSENGITVTAAGMSIAASLRPAMQKELHASTNYQR